MRDNRAMALAVSLGLVASPGWLERPGRSGARTSWRVLVIGGEQGKPLAPGQVSWRYDKQVAAVERRDLTQVQPFCQRDDARIHDLQAQRCVCRQQLCHPAIVVRGGLDNPQLIGGDRGAKLGCELRTAPAPRVRQQMADLRDGQGRDDQAGPVLPEELSTATVVTISRVESRDQRARIAQDHADAAPVASSRSG